jgi:glyoxylase-like metal-dependent hydrolase (beta-lactamase superfamily II)
MAGDLPIRNAFRLGKMRHPLTGEIPMSQAPTKAFASQADLSEKKITFEQLSEHCWAYTAEGDPNSGVIIGDRFIMVSDATATPAMAQDLIKKIRTVSDLPIKYVLLTHYHAVRVLGAYAYAAEGATEIIASQGTLELIQERGAQDMKSEMERFPRLFRGADSIPGLTWPTMVVGGGNPTQGEVPGKLSINLGGVVVQIWHPGPGHTRGDTIAWVEEEKVLFSGDLVEYEAGVYTGDAQLQEWPATLEALRDLKAEFIVPGRGGLHPALGDHLVPGWQRSRGRQDGPQGRHGPHPQEHGPDLWPCVHL